MAKAIIKVFNKCLVEFRHGSSSSNPDCGGMKTSDIVLWVKYNNTFWFRPYGGFGKPQIMQMIDICTNEYQLNAFMELLSAKKEDRINRKESKLPISDVSESMLTELDKLEHEYNHKIDVAGNTDEQNIIAEAKRDAIGESVDIVKKYSH